MMDAIVTRAVCKIELGTSKSSGLAAAIPSPAKAVTRGVHVDLREAIPQALQEGVAKSPLYRRMQLLEAAHRFEPLLEMAVVTLQPIVEILGVLMLRVEVHRSQRRGIALSFVTRDAQRPHSRLVDSSLEETFCARTSRQRVLSVHPVRSGRRRRSRSAL